MLCGVAKKDGTPGEVLTFLKKIGSKGGKSRAKKYGTKTLRRWAIESGAGRPPKGKARVLPVTKRTKGGRPTGRGGKRTQ